MIDQLYVISCGGVVLFHKSFNPTVPARRSTVNTVIQQYLLEDRVGDKESIVDDLKVRWAVHNNPDFFVIAMTPRTRNLLYVEVLLKNVMEAFHKEVSAKLIQSGTYRVDLVGDFNSTFQEIYSDFEQKEKRNVQVGGVPAFLASPTRKGDNVEDSDSGASPAGSPTTGGVQQQSPSAAAATGGGMITKDGRTLLRRGEKPTGCAAAPAPPAATGSKKKPKKPTLRDGAAAVDEPHVGSSTSHSSSPTEDDLNKQTENLRRTFIQRSEDGTVAPIQEHVWSNQNRGRLATWLRGYVGSRELDRQDFAHVIPELREKLIGKNVAVEVAEHVCSSVEASLTGKKIGTFESLHGAIEEAMVNALRRILQPKVEVNILRSVAAAKQRKRPYSIVLCGVNGVGKSTSLSKIAYWLQQNGNSLLVAAGDTFRHGAVEQLEVHGRCLGVPIFQMGYGADPSAVAAAAIAQAYRTKTDVVLVDTAGRMQDHESRMRALAKLIHDNQPDLVLFVGEALVGNNGVDQLRKFNQCLFDFTPVGLTPRGIDGIVLTKFDTIDDKVGAALSMVYELGQPIVFVGVGQTYQDLKVINADVVVSALMQ
ncbi:signal recognition particle receptor, putative [Bodo saltans]|uniref:Signal recognition particle receptor, putative n=1 Tax=Bodo saltans TaxID=75058 RepID=A0A0S4JKS8_BODSA|nr:signal recognition particle receptor, putative [Bodo saltans]|eukprot:CUG89797.1 signal recognition particle receptor, putative [Bodo saltans]